MRRLHGSYTVANDVAEQICHSLTFKTTELPWAVRRHRGRGLERLRGMIQPQPYLHRSYHSCFQHPTCRSMYRTETRTLLYKCGMLTSKRRVTLVMDEGDDACFRQQTALVYRRCGLSVLQPWLFEKPEEPVIHPADDEVSEWSVQRYTEHGFDLL
jgi:hypothetical protein